MGELGADGHDEERHEPERLHLAVHLDQHGRAGAQRKTESKTDDEIQPEREPDGNRQRQAGADEKRVRIRQQRRRVLLFGSPANGGCGRAGSGHVRSMAFERNGWTRSRTVRP